MRMPSLYKGSASGGCAEFVRPCIGSVFVLLALAFGPVEAEADSVESRLHRAADRSDGLVEIDRWAEDAEGRPIWKARIGSGSSETGAVLLVAGLDGRHEIGVELALRHLELMVEDPAQTRALLRGRTVYIVPEMVPAGRTARLSQPSRARATTPGESDSDRDGLVGEDLADDLDGDGVIRQVRVLDPDGNFAVAPSASGLLYEAEAVEDEIGTWRLLTEGRDDDGDENWNEEEDGGVWLARNFPHGYEWFERGRGVHQVSEVETRAVADFLAAHPEIAAVWVYGFEDNLLTPPPKGQSSSPNLSGSRFGRSPISKPNETDLPWLQELSRRYRSILAVPEKATVGFLSQGALAENELPIPTSTEAAQGGLAHYVYYHRGRLALATPGWTPALQKAWNDADSEPEAGEGGENETPDESDDAEPDGEATDAEPDRDGGSDDENDDAEPDRENSGDDERDDSSEDLKKEVVAEEEFIAWVSSRDSLAWQPWSSIAHPDFPGREAWVGGYAPGVRINPPSSEFDSLAQAHHRFLVDLLDLLPQVRLREIELKPLGKSVYELRLVVENIGWLPDVLAQGVYSAVVRPTRYELQLPPDAEVLGGVPRAPLGRIDGRGGAAERVILLRLPNSTAVTVRIVSEYAGRDERGVEAGSEWRVKP